MAREALTMPNLTNEVINNFWDKVAITANADKCWEWLANSLKAGYGKMTINGKTFISTRISFFINKKIDPIGYSVLHSCDNPKCVNPNHLFLGSSKDNSKDMILKGRGKHQFSDGVNHPNSKLTEDKVREIRRKYSEEGMTIKDLSNIYKICQPAMNRIINRKRWKHI